MGQAKNALKLKVVLIKTLRRLMQEHAYGALLKFWSVYLFR